MYVSTLRRMSGFACLVAGLLMASFSPTARAEDGYGDISGQVTLDGAAPPLGDIVPKGDATVKDAAVCAAAAVPNEAVVVDAKTKGVANVFIYLKKAPKIHPSLEKPTEATVTFDQKGCKFLPHALVVRTNQQVKVLSYDAISHNTHTYPLKNPGFNSTIKPSDRTGVMVANKVAESLPLNVKCDYHPWMSAWWLVVDHPYAAVTDAEGKFKIEKLPAGTHEFVVWQESVGYVERKLTVKVDSGKNTDGIKVSLPAAKLKLPAGAK